MRVTLAALKAASEARSENAREAQVWKEERLVETREAEEQTTEYRNLELASGFPCVSVHRVAEVGRKKTSMVLILNIC